MNKSINIAIIIATTIFLCVCITEYTKRIEILVTNGYEQVTLPGESGWAWQKVK